MKLQGKVAIVTGGGRGIGRGIALRFAQEGAGVVVASRTRDEIEKVAGEVVALGRRSLAVVADVSKPKDVARLVRETLKKFGTVDILVNNAAIQGPIGPLVDNDVDQWIMTVHVNLVGPFLCSRAVLPAMIRQRRGKIINLSGGGATSPRARFSAYGASKAALVRLTETLADEVREFNIQVNAIAPGAVNTRLTEEVLAAGEQAGEKDSSEAARVRVSGGVSVDRPAALAVFLASEDSDGLTGRLISAVYDDWESLKESIPQVMTSDVYTLRRVTPK